MNFSSDEIKILLPFLNELSQHFGSAGCNDYHFPDTLTAAEKESFLAKFQEVMGEEAHDRVDICVLGYFIQKIENASSSL